MTRNDYVPLVEILKLPSHEIAYQREGQGAPVLLLGGSGEPMIAWEICGLVQQLLAAGREVIWYAARGVRPSTRPSLPWTLDDLADDAIALMDHLAKDRFAAVGYSLGGFTLECVARREPERVSRAVFLASLGTDTAIRRAVIEAEVAFGSELGHVPQRFSRLMTLMTVLGGPELIGERRVGDWWELLGAQADQWTDHDGEIGQAQAAADWLRRGCSVGEPWPAQVRAHAIGFEYDALFPPNDMRIAATHLNASLAFVPGVGHGGLMTAPQQTLGLVASALDGA